MRMVWLFLIRKTGLFQCGTGVTGRHRVSGGGPRRLRKVETLKTYTLETMVSYRT